MKKCKPGSRSLILLLSGLAALAAMVSGCGKDGTEAVAERRDIVVYLTTNGQVSAPAAATANIVSPYDAPVGRVYVTVGQRVRRGEVLFDLSAPANQEYYQQARQRVIDARNRLNQAQRTYGEALRSAEAQLARARQAERQARQASQASQSVDLAAAIERRMIAEQAVLDAEAQMDASLIPYERHLEQVEEEFRNAQAGRKATQIRTPITGTVLSINAEAGTAASRDADNPMATVVNLEALKVYSEVNEDQAAEIRENAPVVITIREVPGERFNGSVQHVYTGKAGFLQGASYVAVFDFTNHQGKAKPGMSANAAVQIARAEHVLAVPSEAVHMVDDKHAVTVRTGNETRRRIVEIGLSDGHYTQITNGLEEGDVVVVGA